MKKKTLFLLVLILIMQATLHLPFLQEPLHFDEGLFGYVAQRILDGGVPYRDVYDNKPPVVYYLYTIPVGLFGSSVEGIRLFTTAYGLLTTIAMFFAGNLILGGIGGLLAAFIYAIFSSVPVTQGTSSFSETFMVLPLVIALLFFLLAKKATSRQRWWLFLAGLFSGLAFMTKQVALFNFLALLIFTVPLNLPWLILGFLVTPVFFSLYFFLNGALGFFISCCFLSVNTVLKTSCLATSPFLFPLQMSDYIWRLMRLENGVLFLLALAALIIIICEKKKSLYLLVAWALFSLLGTLSAGFFYGHYFIQLIPALSLLAAFAVSHFFLKPGALPMKITLALFIVFILTINLDFLIPVYTKLSPLEINQQQLGRPDYCTSYALAQSLKPKLAKNDEVFIWSGHPELYFYLDKKAPGRYAYLLDWMTSTFDLNLIISEVKTQKPEYIVWTSFKRHLPDFEQWIAANYCYYGQVENTSVEAWRIFKRKTPCPR